MRDEVYDGEEQEGLVRCAMVSYLRVPVSAPVGPEIAEHLEVFLKHLPERAPQALLFLIVETRSDHECNKMMNPLPPERGNTTSSPQEGLRPVIIEIVLGRPVMILIRGKDVPVSKSENVARQILLDLHPSRYEDLILVADTHQAFVE